MPKRSRATQPEYGSQAFWEQRYTSENETLQPVHEWFMSFEDLEPLLNLYLPLGGRGKHNDETLLDLGCGNSTLLTDLADAGYAGPLIGVDYSGSVVAQQTRRCRKRSGVEFMERDARRLDGIEDGSIGTIVDKSTMDTLLHAKDGEASVVAMLGEVSRVLKPGGLYLLVTQLDPEEEADLEFLTGTLLPSLGCEEHHYAVTAHSSSMVAEGAGGGAKRLHLISFRKRPRHAMSLRGGDHDGSVVMRVCDHGEVDEDDEEEEEEEEEEED